MLQFIDWYLEESRRISDANQEESTRTKILSEAKLCCLYSYMQDVIFCVWRAFHEPDNRAKYLVS